jgi:hypothetical protein
VWIKKWSLCRTDYKTISQRATRNGTGFIGELNEAKCGMVPKRGRPEVKHAAEVIYPPVVHNFTRQNYTNTGVDGLRIHSGYRKAEESAANRLLKGAGLKTDGTARMSAQERTERRRAVYTGEQVAIEPVVRTGKRGPGRDAVELDTRERSDYSYEFSSDHSLDTGHLPNGTYRGDLLDPKS